MGRGRDDTLTENLVSPESVDNPDREWTKGEEQPRGCRDIPFALLFYAQFAAVAVFCFWLGVPVVTKQIENNQGEGNDTSSGVGYDVNYVGLMYLVMAASVRILMGYILSFDEIVKNQGSNMIHSTDIQACAFFLSGVSLGIMSCCPKILIQMALLASLAVSLAICVYSFIYSSILGGVFGAIIFALSLCYACAVWRRIPFAAANLETAIRAVRKNAFVFILAFIFVALMFGKSDKSS